ncbi:MAG: hypothetical protein DHS80DRAFT_32940 [Piptocephalis tieghemiana]|nr:MAG: hypothetical protein DHS80DRAFT_32940 [Piptocephalis tieghemiana]
MQLPTHLLVSLAFLGHLGVTLASSGNAAYPLAMSHDNYPPQYSSEGYPSRFRHTFPASLNNQRSFMNLGTMREKNNALNIISYFDLYNGDREVVKRSVEVAKQYYDCLKGKKKPISRMLGRESKSYIRCLSKAQEEIKKKVDDEFNSMIFTSSLSVSSEVINAPIDMCPDILLTFLLDEIKAPENVKDLFSFGSRLLQSINSLLDEVNGWVKRREEPGLAKEFLEKGREKEIRALEKAREKALKEGGRELGGIYYLVKYYEILPKKVKELMSVNEGRAKAYLVRQCKSIADQIQLARRNLMDDFFKMDRRAEILLPIKFLDEDGKPLSRKIITERVNEMTEAKRKQYEENEDAKKLLASLDALKKESSQSSLLLTSPYYHYDPEA